jgi:hypothetical protein
LDDFVGKHALGSPAWQPESERSRAVASLLPIRQGLGCFLTTTLRTARLRTARSGCKSSESRR